MDEKLVVALARAVAALHVPLDRHVAEAGFTPGQFAVLEALLHKGSRTINQLIGDVLTTSGNITVVIDNLLKAGLLEKRPVADDGRKRLICLTAEGRGRIEAYYPQHEAELKRLFGEISTAEKRALTRSLLSLRKGLEATSSNQK